MFYFSGRGLKGVISLKSQDNQLADHTATGVVSRRSLICLLNYLQQAGFEVLTAVTKKGSSIWDATKPTEASGDMS
jgi:hypothetical protein